MTDATRRRMTDLLTLLDELQAMHAELLEVIREKIEAMRRADVATMHRISERERALVERISRREGLRKQLMTAIGKELGLSQQYARNLTATSLAERVGREFAEPLAQKSAGLKDVMTELMRVNHVAGMITREVLRHIEAVFDGVRKGRGEAVGYAPSGRSVADNERSVLELVG